jgi:hypothetical protein
MFHLSNYGTEAAQQQELSRRLGAAWKENQEIGRFYNKAGSDTWYYSIYAPNQPKARTLGLPKNEFASNFTGPSQDRTQRAPIYGDVAIVRSAPSQYRSVCPETFTKTALVKDIGFNLENDPFDTCLERERSQAEKN